jgi:hypothetical protein
LQNVHCARSACKKKLINSLVTVLMHSNQSWFFCFFGGLEHQPSPRGWAESSPVFCRLEHQPSPRGWVESSLVAGPIYFILFLFSFLFFVFIYIYIYIYIYIFWKLWFSNRFFYIISTNIGLYFYILKIQIRY